MERSLIRLLTLLEREVHRFLKVTVQTVLSPLVSATLYLLVFGVTLGADLQMGEHSYLEFLVPGLVMMGLVNNAFGNSSSSIVGAKFTGELEDFRIVPLTDSQLIWGLSLGSVVRGAVVGLVTYLVGATFLKFQMGHWLWLAHPLELVYFILGGGLVFGQLGIAVAIWAKNFDQLGIVGSFVLLPLIYLGGVFLSLAQLPPWLAAVTQWNPLFYFINGFRHAMLGTSDVPILHSALVVAACVVLFHFVARFSLRRGSFHRW